VIIDGCIFTTPDFGPAARFWREVTPRLGKLLGQPVYYLHRASVPPPFPADAAVKVLAAPPLDIRDYAVEQRRLAALCRELSVPLFASTRFTLAAPTPSIFVLADGFPFLGEIAVTSLLARQTAIESAALCLTLSDQGSDYLVSGYQVPRDHIRRLGLGGADPFVNLDRLAADFATAVKEIAP
jgi:hypothetical protein